MSFLDVLSNSLAVYGASLLHFLDPEFVLLMLGGVLVGVIVGILPGLGSIVGLAVFLPFAFLLTPFQAAPFMVGMLSVTFTGGSLTTILLGIPGTPGNLATLMDGFPMAKKGQAGRAIGAAVTASTMGSIYTALFALIMIPLIIPIVMGITSAEMVFLVVLGISVVGTIARGSKLKGLISGTLGLLVSLIGYHAVTAAGRFNFGSTYLYGGLPLIPVVLGLFAIPPMLELATTGGTVAKEEMKLKGMQDIWLGVKDVFARWALNLRCSIIGYIAGLIPGIGAGISTFVAYGHAKMGSKHPELFGTGIIDGVIAPESANNAKEGGALLTTLALGIPGSSIYVVVLGIFIMVGLVPGPDMLTKHLELSFSMVMVIAVSGVIAWIICLALAPYLAKIAYLPGRILVPMVLTVVFVGTYASGQMLLDIVVLVIFGALGLIMLRFGYDTISFALGFILGAMFERYLFISLMAWGNLFFLRPACLGIIFVIIIFMGYPLIKRAWQRLFKEGVKA